MSKTKRAKDPKFKFKCPKGKHKGWHYLPVTFTGPPDEDGAQTVYYTIVECYGTPGKKRGHGYCKPFMIHESENDLYRALSMMISDIDRYKIAPVESNPWEDGELRNRIELERMDAARKVSKWHCDMAMDPTLKLIPALIDDATLRRVIGDEKEVSDPDAVSGESPGREAISGENIGPVSAKPAEPLLVSWVCAKCGAFARRGGVDMIDSGTTLRCDICAGETVFDLDTPEVRAERYESAQRGRVGYESGRRDEHRHAAKILRDLIMSLNVDSSRRASDIPGFEAAETYVIEGTL